ncbi:MAG: ImmA/IrrE family metallo-endopeptidase, partial [Betaproteobacteria bacterium]
MISAGVDHPPTNLERLAKHLNVEAISYAPLSMRARLMMDCGKLIAEINEDLDPFARRWSLAHELAHVVLERERLGLATTVGQNVERAVSN